MSINSDFELDLDNRRYMMDLKLKDPQSGNTRTIPFEIDTGCGLSLAVPDSHDDLFSVFMGPVPLSGGGAEKAGRCPSYQTEIVQIGDIDCNQFTTAYVVLDGNDHNYGLIGIDLLSRCTMLMHDGPKDPKLEIELTHIPTS